MTNKKEGVERRKHKRFQAPENALVVFRPRAIKVGLIIDISMGGLTFRYTDMDREEPSKESFELDIILLDSDFRLEKVPFKSQRDVEIHRVPVGPKTMTMRQCTVQFGELTQNQIFQLERFIKDHTQGEV